MPSLKDLKNRIASVKSTQKITKAMQMVAAAKLRRAQDAAVAARPMPNGWATCCRRWARLMPARRTLRRCSAAMARTRFTCSSSRRASDGLAGGFNSSIARLARDSGAAADRRRQDGEDPHRRPQGQRHPQAHAWRQYRRCDLVPRSPQCRLCAGGHGGREGARHVRGGRVRRRDAVLRAVQIGDQPGADGAAADPGTARDHRSADRRNADLRIRAERRGDPRGSAAAQHLGSGAAGAARRTARRSTGRR